MWQWRNFVCVTEFNQVTLSCDKATTVPLTTHVPIAAGGSRRFYLYYYAGMENPIRPKFTGIAYRRYKSRCAQDLALTLYSASGNFGSAPRRARALGRHAKRPPALARARNAEPMVPFSAGAEAGNDLIRIQAVGQAACAGACPPTPHRAPAPLGDDNLACS